MNEIKKNSAGSIAHSAERTLTAGRQVEQSAESVAGQRAESREQREGRGAHAEGACFSLGAMRYALCSMQSSRKGFTLAEVVISGVILTILAFGMIPTITNTKKAQMGVRDKIIAASILEREMNELRVLGAKNLPLEKENRETTKGMDGLDGLVSYTITTDPSNSEDKFVYISFEWDGGIRKQSLATFMFQEN